MASGQGSDSGLQTPNPAQSRDCWYYNLKEQKMMPYSSTPLSEEDRHRVDPSQELSEFDTMRGVSAISGSGYRAQGDMTSYETKNMTLEQGMEGEGAGLSMTDRVTTAGQALKNIMAETRG